MADWSLPIITTAYDLHHDDLLARDVDSATMFVSAPTNTPTGAIKWNRSTSKFQEWDGALWNDLALSTGLSLGTMATQNANAVAITGGTIGTAVNIDAARLTSNQVAVARLATGTPDAHNFVRGDGTWAKAVPVGTVSVWMTASAPTDCLVLDGSAIVRATYADLFALWGVTFGAGNGTTTFNLPDLRGKYVMGKTAAGTGSTLNGTFGTIDHTHTISSDGGHTHTGPSHSHTAATGATAPATDVQGNHAHTVNTTPFGETIDKTGAGGGVVADDITYTSSTTGAHAHTVNSHTHTISADGTGATSSDGAHSHTGATGANNPPTIAINWIVRAL